MSPQGNPTLTRAEYRNIAPDLQCSKAMQISKLRGRHFNLDVRRLYDATVQTIYGTARYQEVNCGVNASALNMRLLAFLLLALALVGAYGCSGSMQQPSATDAADAAHPLVGKIWAAGSASYIDPDSLAAAVADADYLLLGEVHDNPKHHQLQAWLIAGFAGAPQSVTVGFEQINSDQAAPLAQYLLDNPGNASDLGAAIAWSESGWPAWSLYEPVFQQVVDRGWQPVPLMFASARNKAILETGFDAVLDPNALDALQPGSALSPTQKAEVEALMRSSHCDRLPEEYLPQMVTIQTARDAYMAWKQFESGPRGILIVGDGHARKDRGIPLFLRKLKPEATIVVVSMTEVAPGLEAPADYQQTLQSYSDYVLFTERQERDDPCATI